MRIFWKFSHSFNFRSDERGLANFNDQRKPKIFPSQKIFYIKFQRRPLSIRFHLVGLLIALEFLACECIMFQAHECNRKENLLSREWFVVFSYYFHTITHHFIFYFILYLIDFSFYVYFFIFIFFIQTNFWIASNRFIPAVSVMSTDSLMANRSFALFFYLLCNYTY